MYSGSLRSSSKYTPNFTKFCHFWAETKIFKQSKCQLLRFKGTMPVTQSYKFQAKTRDINPIYSNVLWEEAVFGLF